MAESEVIQQASRIVGLVMGGSSIEDAMEEVIGPGDWSEQATELANLIEQAAADQFGRVEDAFYQKDRFEGDNCGIGSEGFKPGNKCGAKRGKGGAKPKGSTPRKPRKKAEPAAEAPAAPEAPESKPKRGRKPKATPAATAAPKPRALRVKKPKPKPSALQRGREVMHRLDKALRKMGAQTLKGLAKRVRAMRKAGGGLAKAAGRAAGAVAKGAGEAIRRAAPAGRRLAKAHHATIAPVKSASESARKALEPIMALGWDSDRKMLSSLGHIEFTISGKSYTNPKEAQADAKEILTLIRQIKSNTDLKTMVATVKAETKKGSLVPQAKKDLDAFMGSIKALETAAKARKAAADAWVKQSGKKGKMSKRIEDKFYFGRRKVCFEGDNCGIGSEGFKPGNKCGAKQGKGGSKAKPKGKGKAKPEPKPSPEGPWPKRATPSTGQRRRAEGEPSKRLGDAVVSGLSNISQMARGEAVEKLKKKSGHKTVDAEIGAAVSAIESLGEIREMLSYHAFRVARGKTESREELRQLGKRALGAMATLKGTRANLQTSMETLQSEQERIQKKWEALIDSREPRTDRFYEKKKALANKWNDVREGRKAALRAMQSLRAVPDFSDSLKQLMRI